MSEQTILKDDVRIGIKKPNMYRVVLLNDDYTTMEFVVEVLMGVFHKTVPEATKIMLDVHEKGKGVVGVYTYDIASTKIAQVEGLASKRGYPLKAVMEEE